LNCHKIFFSPALGPVILDLAWIAGVLAVPFISADVRVQLHWLTGTLLISGLVQWMAQWPDLKRIGFRFRWIWDVADAGLKRTVYLLLPSVLSFAIVQINLLVDSTLAFLVGPGANSALWYGNRLMQFPLGVFAITMGTALLPTIAAQAAAKNFDGAKKSLSFSLRSVCLSILPSSVGHIVLSRPMVQMLFERGEFDGLSTLRTAAVVVCYSIGLFAYSGQKIIAAGFYALQDTRTPVKAGVIALLSNIVFNLILMQYLREAGLALATSISGTLQLAVLLFWFSRKVPDFAFSEVFLSFGKILAASVLMGFFCWGSFAGLEAVLPGTSTGVLAVRVFLSIAASVIFFILMCMILRVHEMKEALDWIVSRRRMKSVNNHASA
jgi:putative peptidoglycan lipid II flippase